MSILNFFKCYRPEDRGNACVDAVHISKEEVAACKKEVEAVVVRQQKTTPTQANNELTLEGTRLSMVPRQHQDNSQKSWDIQSLSQLHASFAIYIAQLESS